MDEEKPSARWERLLREEQEAFELAARHHKRCGPGVLANQAALKNRDWYNANSRLLLTFCDLARTVERYFDDGEPFEPPVQAIRRIANVAATIASGQTHPSLQYARGPGGRPDRWPAERRSLAFAVFYIEACRHKKLKDDKYLITVHEAYNVDRSTVLRWAGKERENICRDIDPPDEYRIRRLMLVEGHNFQYNHSGVSHVDWCIGVAIHYIENSKISEASDNEPCDSVMKEFGVGRPTVQQWLKDAEMYCEKVPQPHPEVLYACMSSAGAAYRENH